MPRSVNSAASKARKKKILKQAKGFMASAKMFIRLLKMLLRKG